MDMILSINLIVSNPDVRSGHPHIARTTITVADVAVAMVFQMLDVDEIANQYELSLQQVYAALAYYYDHKAEIDQTIQKQRKLAEQLKEQRVGSRHKPLFG